MSERQRASDSWASAPHDWLRQPQHTEAVRRPGGSCIWPISSQPLQWLSTPLRACWNNIIRTCKCWRPPCPLPAQNSASKPHSDLSALNPDSWLTGVSSKTEQMRRCLKEQSRCGATIWICEKNEYLTYYCYIIFALPRNERGDLNLSTSWRLVEVMYRIVFLTAGNSSRMKSNVFSAAKNHSNASWPDSATQTF